MADDDDGKIGSESWRRQFFHDLRYTVRDEVGLGAERIERSVESHVERLERAISALSERMERVINASVESLRHNRIDDTKEAFLQILELKPDQVPEVAKVVQTAITARRVRLAVWGPVWSTVKSSTSEVVRHAVAVAVISIGGYLIVTKWGWWPAWLK